jgi:hypothetical protein
MLENHENTFARLNGPRMTGGRAVDVRGRFTSVTLSAYRNSRMAAKIKVHLVLPRTDGRP